MGLLMVVRTCSIDVHSTLNNAALTSNDLPKLAKVANLAVVRLIPKGLLRYGFTLLYSSILSFKSSNINKIYFFLKKF